MVFFQRYLHRTDRTITKRFLFLNQLAIWSCHVLAWFAYSVIIYAQHGEEAGMLRILPLIVALVSFGPMFSAIHWALVINPSYTTKESMDKANENQPDLAEMDKKYLYRSWQVSTIIVRLTSLALLCFVYFDHWLEVGAFAVAVKVPYLLLILVANMGLQYACFGRSLRSALLSSLVPNGFRRVSVGKAGRYIILNVSLNLCLHLILWLSMTFFCWDCTKELDAYFMKLQICFPVAVGLWMAGLVFTLATWRLSIRRSLGSVVKENYHSAWTDRETAVSTKF